MYSVRSFVLLTEMTSGSHFWIFHVQYLQGFADICSSGALCKTQDTVVSRTLIYWSRGSTRRAVAKERQEARHSPSCSASLWRTTRRAQFRGCSRSYPGVNIGLVCISGDGGDIIDRFVLRSNAECVSTQRDPLGGGCYSAARHGCIHANRSMPYSEMDAQRALLDELMGPQRDVPESQRREIKFDDHEIDKFWLVGMQPFDMFRNTPWSTRLPDIYRRALGREWTGDEKAQPKEVLEQYAQLPAKAKERYGYEGNLFLFLDELVRTNDRAVQRARQAHEAKACEITDAEAEKLRSVEAEIAKLTKEAEAAGEQGDVDTSLSLMSKVEDLNKQRDAVIKPQDARIQKVLVCEVSGNVVQNTEVRIQEHYSGRIYLSWKAVRDKLAELRAKFNNKPPPRPILSYDWRADPDFFPSSKRRPPQDHRSFRDEASSPPPESSDQGRSSSRRRRRNDDEDDDDRRNRRRRRSRSRDRRYRYDDDERHHYHRDRRRDQDRDYPRDYRR